MDLKKNTKSNEKIKNAIIDVIQSSSSHGIPNIFKSSNISIKLMWILFTLISAGLFAFMVIDNLMSYFKFEVTTKSRVVFELVSEFPTVTICNINYFTSHYSQEIIENYKENYKYHNPLSDYFKLWVKSEIMRHNQLNYPNNFGDSLQKMIVYCVYKGMYCNQSEFSYFYHPIYGNCYQFNSGFDINNKKIDLKTSFSSDRIDGLKLILNISVHEGLKFMNPNLGAVIFIHNHTTYPMIVDETTVAPKFETNIAVSRTFYQSQPKPYSNCDGNTHDKNNYDSELYKLVHENTKEYSHILCYYQCIQKHLIDKCNCTMDTIPSFYSSNNCPFNDDCLTRYLSDIPYSLRNCVEKCPLECEGKLFDKTISFIKYSNPFFETSNYLGTDSIYFNQTVNSEDLAVVNIFYKSLTYSSTTENPTKTVIDLLSSIGGVSGLFLGCSLLTFVELIEILMKIILVAKENNKIFGNN